MDILGKAEKFLAVVISHVHHLGVHRDKTATGEMSYAKEMSRRLWWCLFVLDRRLAIESGRTSLIQYINASTPLPQSLYDYLHCYRSGSSLAITPRSTTLRQWSPIPKFLEEPGRPFVERQEPTLHLITFSKTISRVCSCKLKWAALAIYRLFGRRGKPSKRKCPMVVK